MNFREWDPGTRGVTGISVHQYGELEATHKGFKGLESTDLIEITGDLIQKGELGIEGFWCFLGVWSRNLQGMILNQKGEVAALECKEKIYGSVFLRVWKVWMGTRPSSPPASVRSVKWQLVMEKEQNSRRRRVSQTPNLMPPNLRSIMTTQEVEGLCEQLAYETLWFLVLAWMWWWFSWSFSYGFKTPEAMSARWFYYRGATVFGLIKPSTDITCVYGGV
ncbi:hypothetical protein IGI04_040020 [Brassica rapa subsp. trilocularis]|uniref:Uncharacterized protein n=1 Tax=Brassica rapa subsp. trilocularis TaxID=1813537 RepID=A0ABQ7KMH0_BRACM|nr:hypothetical protein IGI04_040020 [Brassica rapa subsp. trilocularis]